MDATAIVGTIVTLGALSVIGVLVVWSRRTIESLARSGPRSVREFRQERRDRRPAAADDAEGPDG